MPTTKTTITSALASIALYDAYTDFTLSRQAMNCSPFTMRFYRFTAGAFVTWIAGQGIASPHEVTARYVRQYLAMVEHYAQMVDEDLLEAHKAHSPVDRL